MHIPPRRSIIALLVSPLVALAALALLLDVRDRMASLTTPPSVPLVVLFRLHVSWILDHAPHAYLATALLAVPCHALLTRRGAARLLPTLLVGIVAGIAAVSWYTFHVDAEGLALGSLGGLVGALTYWYGTHFSLQRARAAV